MAGTSDAEFRALSEQLDEAWTADVPNLVEIRKCREKMIEHIALCVIEVMDGGKDEPSKQLALQVINNSSPLTSSPRGIRSPLKTEEINRFEDLVRNVFGDIESCTTAW